MLKKRFFFVFFLVLINIYYSISYTVLLLACLSMSYFLLSYLLPLFKCWCVVVMCACCGKVLKLILNNQQPKLFQRPFRIPGHSRLLSCTVL